VAADEGFTMTNRIAYREEMRSNINKVDLILSGVRAVEQAVRGDAITTGDKGPGDVLRELNFKLLDSFPERVPSRPGVMLYKASLKPPVAPADCDAWQMTLVSDLPAPVVPGASATAEKVDAKTTKSFVFELTKCGEAAAPLLRLSTGASEFTLEFDNDAVVKAFAGGVLTSAGKVPWKPSSKGSCTLGESEGRSKVSCSGIALPLSPMALASIETLSIDLNGETPLAAEVLFFEYSSPGAVEPFRQRRLEIAIKNGEGVKLSSKPVAEAK
jgi:hypothetical protein